MPHYPMQSTLPHYHEDVFGDLAIGPHGNTQIQWTPPNMQGVGAASAADVAASPLLAAIKVLRGANGLGQDAGPAVPPKPTAGTYAVVVAFLALGGFLSYQAGKAMTPQGGNEKTWSWAAVPVGLFTGVLGLGIMGAVSNAKEK